MSRRIGFDLRPVVVETKKQIVRCNFCYAPRKGDEADCEWCEETFPVIHVYSPIRCDFCHKAQNPNRMTCELCGEEYSSSKYSIESVRIEMEGK